MIKNKEIRQIIIDILLEPQDEEDDCYLIDKKQISKLLKYINHQQSQEERLKKTEELLGLYKQLHKEIDLSVGKDSFDDWNGGGTYHYIEIDTEKDHTVACDILEKIKELEKELGL